MVDRTEPDLKRRIKARIVNGRLSLRQSRIMWGMAMAEITLKQTAVLPEGAKVCKNFAAALKQAKELRGADILTDGKQLAAFVSAVLPGSEEETILKEMASEETGAKIYGADLFAELKNWNTTPKNEQAVKLRELLRLFSNVGSQKVLEDFFKTYFKALPRR